MPAGGSRPLHHNRKFVMPAKEAIYRKIGVSRTIWQKSPCPAICSGKSCGGSMVCGQDPLRCRPRKSTARYKTIGEVRLDDEKLNQMGFRIRPNYPNWAVSKFIWEMSVQNKTGHFDAAVMLKKDS